MSKMTASCHESLGITTITVWPIHWPIAALLSIHFSPIPYFSSHKLVVFSFQHRNAKKGCWNEWTKPKQSDNSRTNTNRQKKNIVYWLRVFRSYRRNSHAILKIPRITWFNISGVEWLANFFFLCLFVMLSLSPDLNNLRAGKFSISFCVLFFFIFVLSVVHSDSQHANRVFFFYQDSWFYWIQLKAVRAFGFLFDCGRLRVRSKKKRGAAMLSGMIYIKLFSVFFLFFLCYILAWRSDYIMIRGGFFYVAVTCTSFVERCRILGDMIPDALVPAKLKDELTTEMRLIECNGCLWHDISFHVLLNCLNPILLPFFLVKKKHAQRIRSTPYVHYTHSLHQIAL